jgi:2TM domain
MKNYNKQNDAHSRAIYKVKRIKRFYKHLAAYIIVNTLFIVLKIVRNFDRGDDFFEIILDFNFGNLWFLWGIGLAFHAFAVFGTDYFFGKNWEENKINQIMEEDELNENSNRR